MAVVDRLKLEERIQIKTKQESDEEMKKIVQKLLHLQSGLKKEQARMESLMSKKDVQINQLQLKVGQLGRENQRLTSLAGVNRNICITEDNIEELTSSAKVSKLVMNQRHQINSDSGCENLTSDNASLSDDSNEVLSDMIHTKHSIPTITNQNCPIEIMVKRLGPKPPIASRESVNAKLHLDPLPKTDYVLVTKTVSDTNHKTGLYVLDTLQPNDDHDQATTTDTNTSVAATATTTVTPVHALTNHRAGLKLSDIKYRAKMKAFNCSQKTTLSYWTDTFL